MATMADVRKHHRNRTVKQMMAFSIFLFSIFFMFLVLILVPNIRLNVGSYNVSGTVILDFRQIQGSEFFKKRIKYGPAMIVIFDNKSIFIFSWEIMIFPSFI